MSTARKKRKSIRPKTRKLLSAGLPDSGPGEWDEMQGLREAVLVSFPPQLCAVLRWLAGNFFSYVLEEHGTPDRPYTGSTAKGQLYAAMLDLRFTARFLAFSAREAVEIVSTSPAEKEAGYFADEIAAEVERLADRIDSRIRRKSSQQRRRSDATSADTKSNTVSGRSRRSAANA